MLNDTKEKRVSVSISLAESEKTKLKTSQKNMACLFLHSCDWLRKNMRQNMLRQQTSTKDRRCVF